MKIKWSKTKFQPNLTTKGGVCIKFLDFVGCHCNFNIKHGVLVRV